MENTIKIMAEILPHDQASCKFTVDRVLFKGFARFADRERVKGSPLAERLFKVEGVIGIQINQDRVTVTKQNFDNWRTVGPAIGAAIREHIQSGAEAVSPEYAENLPAEDQLRARVQAIIDQQINPAVASHGGHIALLDVKDNNVYIKMGGGCQGCGQADVTLKEGIEQTLRAAVPEINEIIDGSDHAAGENPYYRGA